MELHINKLTFASTFRMQQPPSTVAPIKQKTNRRGPFPNFTAKIRDKRERILGLQKEIEDSEEEIINQERVEEEFDPEKGEEDLFDVVVPALESDLYGLRVENEIEIMLLEEEIVQLGKRSKKGKKK